MFTGIIQETGTISRLAPQGDSIRISVTAPATAAEAAAGDSVSINGICLTAVEKPAGNEITFDAVRETLSRTTLAAWKRGDTVNLEQAMTLESKFGGHIVQGHVDGTAVLNRTNANRTGIELVFTAEGDYLKYIVAKGSIAVNGVSLTVARLQGKEVRIAVVPFTLDNTNLKGVTPGSAVNIETDILGRYVERLMGGEANGLTMNSLRKSGFGLSGST